MTAAILKSRENVLILILVFIYVIANMIFAINEIYYFNLLPVSLFVIWLAFARIDLFYFLIIVLTPVSIQLIEFIPGSSMDFAIPTEPLLFGGMLLLLYKSIIKGYNRNVLSHPVTYAVAFYLFWTLFTSLTSTDPMISLKQFIARLWFVSVFYFLAISIFYKFSKIRAFIWCYAVPMIGVIVFTISRHLSYGLNDQLAAHTVMNPFFRDHTSYGAILAMLLFAVSGILLGYGHKHMLIKILSASALLLIIAALVLSYTRAAWVSVFSAIVLMFTILARIRPSFIFAACIGIVVVLTARSDSIIETMQRTREESSTSMSSHLKSVSNITTDESNLERINRWNSAITMFRERPFFGWGPGTYMFEYAPFQMSYDMTGISTNSGDKGNAHSEYLGPLAESGLAGMLSFIILGVAGIATGLRVYKRLKKKNKRMLVLGMILGLFTYLVHGLLNNFLDTDKASALFWGFIAAFVSLDLKPATEEKNNNLAGET
jgi:putative inorganic carbon (hco3(-)) transporter